MWRPRLLKLKPLIHRFQVCFCKTQKKALPAQLWSSPQNLEPYWKQPSLFQKKTWYWNLKTFVNISIHNFYFLFEFVQDIQLLLTTKGEFQLIPLMITSFSYQTVLKGGHLKSTFQLASAYLFSLVLLQNQFLPFCISSLWLTWISWNKEIE